MSRKIRRSVLFSKDVASLMYAYGDVSQPLPETVQCIDELVASYLADICANAYFSAQTVKRNKIKVEDFRFVLRKDPVKLGRAEELIRMNKIITDARKQFDNSEGKSLKRTKDEIDDEHLSPDEDEDLKTASNQTIKRSVGRPRKKTTEIKKRKKDRSS